MLHNEARELLVQGYEATVLSSIRLDGEKAFTTYQGGTTGERFVQYLKETILPPLRRVTS